MSSTTSSLDPSTTISSTTEASIPVTTSIFVPTLEPLTTEPLTTIFTTEVQTTVKPTQLVPTAPPRTQTTTEIPTVKQSPPVDLPTTALQPCFYAADLKVKHELMEVCKPFKKCRTNEFVYDEFVNGERLCCCDLQKDFPPPSEFDPKLLAPKCFFDPDGNVIPFSTLTTGLDLICPPTSQMLNYTDEITPSSCCILKDQTTIEPKVI